MVFPATPHQDPGSDINIGIQTNGSGSETPHMLQNYIMTEAVAFSQVLVILRSTE